MHIIGKEKCFFAAESGDEVQLNEMQICSEVAHITNSVKEITFSLNVQKENSKFERQNNIIMATFRKKYMHKASGHILLLVGQSHERI